MSKKNTKGKKAKEILEIILDDSHIAEKEDEQALEKMMLKQKQAVEQDNEQGDEEHFERVIKICCETVDEVISEIGEYMASDNPKVTVSGTNGEVIVKISAERTEEKTAKKIGKPVAKEIKSIFGAKIYTTDASVTLQETIVALLKENDLKVTTAESCTGGMISARLVDVPGVSEVFNEAYVTYSNKAKRTRLGVKKPTLIKYGAVSSETAKEMAKGAISSSKADAAIAVTGIAGPDGATADKPVGLVYVACFVCGKTQVKEFTFKGDRQAVREQTVSAALGLLRMCVLEYYSERHF